MNGQLEDRLDGHPGDHPGDDHDSLEDSDTDWDYSKDVEHLQSEISRLRSLVETLAESSSAGKGASAATPGGSAGLSGLSGPPPTLGLPTQPAGATSSFVKSQSNSSNDSHTTSEPVESHGLNWLSDAAQEISQLTQRRLNPGGLGSASIYLLEPSAAHEPAPPVGWDDIPSWPSRMHDSNFRQSAFQVFIDHVNRVECLIDHEYLQQTTPSLDQPYHMLLLVLAIIAASTAVTHEYSIGDSLVQCAERMVMRACISQEATLVVIRALTCLVWRELTVGGNPTRTWMFNCMAAALLQQLGVFNWSSETIEQEKQSRYFREKLTAFWSFSAVDRICAALLGRMSSIPWRHNICVPRYATVIQGIPPIPKELPPPPVESVFFDHLWELWRLHCYYMNFSYSPRFDLMKETERQTMRRDCRKAMADLRANIDPRLRLLPLNEAEGANTGNGADGMNTANAPSPFVFFLDMAFETSPITLNMPYLSRSNNEQFQSLQEMVHGASIHADLLIRYRRLYSFCDTPPVISYFTVRAATIHLLLATSTDLAVQRRSAQRLKICLESLEETQRWERQSGRAIKYIQGLANRWGVAKSLPSKFQPGNSMGNSSNSSASVIVTTLPNTNHNNNTNDTQAVDPTTEPNGFDPSTGTPSGDGFDPALWYDVPATDLDISGLEIEAIQWAISQDTAYQLMHWGPA